jgi:branched-chain amino acid transport system substrate-binding protein
MEQCWRPAAIVGVLATLALVGFACTPDRQEPAATVSAAGNVAPPSTTSPALYRRSGPQGLGISTGPIARMGAALSLTGTARLFGIAQRSGIKLAQDEINASHLLGSVRLEVIVDDDGSDREQASAVFHRFIENSHVLAIIGPTLSDTALSVDPLAQQAGVPVLAISNAASGLNQIGNFIFRESLSEIQLTPQIISTIRSRMKVHSAALLSSETDPNRSGSHGFKAALQNSGVRITTEQTFSKDQSDFSPQLEEIAMTRPDAVFVTAPSSAAATILIQARQHGLDKTPIVGSNAFNSDAVLRTAGDAAEGLIVGSAWSADKPSPRNQQFIQSYRARYGVDPDQIAAQAYTGVYILAAALKNASTASDPHALRDALEHLKGLDTPLGTFSFNDAHDPDYPALVQVVHLGHFQPF